MPKPPPPPLFVWKFNRVVMLVSEAFVNAPLNCPVELSTPLLQITIARLVATVLVNPVAKEKLVSLVASLLQATTSIGLTWLQL
jgi:hypothetical protein